MKKIVFVFICILSLVATLTSCEEKIQKCRAAVKEMNDSAMVTKIDKYDIKFDTKQAKFMGGAVMPGDSVVIDYVGDLRDKTAKAVIVSLIPPKPNYIEAGYDPSKKLETSPMSKEEVKEMEDFMKRAHENGR